MHFRFSNIRMNSMQLLVRMIDTTTIPVFSKALICRKFTDLVKVSGFHQQDTIQNI